VKTKKFIILWLSGAGFLYTEYKKFEIVRKLYKENKQIKLKYNILIIISDALIEKNKKLEKFLEKNSKEVEKIFWDK
jgi:hypothetical protein